MRRHHRVIAPLAGLALGLALALAASGGVASVQAQETDITTNADGADVRATPGSPANGDGGDVVYGDIGPGAAQGPPPSETRPAESTDSAAQPAPGDPDGDNLDDAREAELGTDPNDIDSDDDQIDDGYEANGLGTDPLAYDTDGDGLFDGEEVYATFTDPLVADAPAGAAPAAAPAPSSSAPPPGNGSISTQPGNATTYGDEDGSANAAPGTIN